MSKKDKKGAMSTRIGTLNAGNVSAASKYVNRELARISTCNVKYCGEIGLVCRKIVAPGEVPYTAPPAAAADAPAAGGGERGGVKRERAEGSMRRAERRRIKLEGEREDLSGGGSAGDAIFID